MNQNELAKEICKREQGEGRGLNIAQVKTVLRHLGDIELEIVRPYMDDDFCIKEEYNSSVSRKSVLVKINGSAIIRYKKNEFLK